MQSPIDSTTSSSTETPAPESTLTPAPALTSMPTVLSTPESIASPDSTVSLTPITPTTSPLTPNLALASTSAQTPAPNLALAATSAQTPVWSSWESAWASAQPPVSSSWATAWTSGMTPNQQSATSAETPTSSQSSTWAGFSSQLDPQQLRFQIGPSTSTGASPPAPSCKRPSTSSSNFKGPGLFGSNIVTEDSKVPGLFKFESKAPVARKQAGQSQPGPSGSKNVPEYTSMPGTSGLSQRSPFLNLGPDVVIRPISSSSIRNTTAPKQTPHQTPHQSPHGLQDSEVTQLLSGYKFLKEEVASLKVQLANGQALMQEILNNFSSEVARINIRLSALERVRIGQREGQRRAEQQRRMEQQRRVEEEREARQGRLDPEQRRMEQSQGRMEQGQERINQGQGRIAIETANDNENDEQGLSGALGDMTLAK